MDSVSYKTVLDQFTDLIGAVVGQVTTVDSDSFNRFFNRVARRGWGFSFWPSIMLLEQRYYRDAWSATAYVPQAEVYYAAAAGSYWRANDDTIAGDIPGASDKWDLITSLDAYIGYEQAGKTPLGGVKAVWSENHRTSSSAYQLPFELDERGARLVGSSVPTSAWIYFRPRCPVWKGAAFDPAATYASGRTRYYSSANEDFDGDFWTTTAATAAGESPETTPAKWTKIAVPAFLCDFAANGAKLGYLEGDGQLEKVLANAESSLWAHLYDELDKIEGQSGQYRRARVANI